MDGGSRKRRRNRTRSSLISIQPGLSKSNDAQRLNWIPFSGRTCDRLPDGKGNEIRCREPRPSASFLPLARSSGLFLSPSSFLELQGESKKYEPFFQTLRAVFFFGFKCFRKAMT